MARLGMCKGCHKPLTSDVRTCKLCGATEPYGPVPMEIRLMLVKGKMSEAIRRVQELTGLGPTEAFEFVSSVESERPSKPSV